MARYKMRKRLLSFGDDFTIEDDQGRAVYTVDGKVLRIRDTFVLADTSGNEVATIREKKLALHESMNILRRGNHIATIRKAWLTPLRDKFVIDVEGEQSLVAQGNILDHEYVIHRNDVPVATISKQWFTIRDTYGIEVVPGEDNGLVLAIAVAIDEMVHN